MSSRSEYLRLLLALAAAAGAALVTSLLLARVYTSAPGWAWEAAIATVIAAAWMWAGLVVAPRRLISGVALFLAGAALAWIVRVGMAFGGSPYYGLIPFASACAGAAVVWFVRVRKLDDRRAPFSAIAVPLFVACVATAIILSARTVGFARVDETTAESAVEAFTVNAINEREQQTYVWTPDRSPESAASDSTSMRLKLSRAGASPYVLKRVTDRSEWTTACNLFRESARLWIALDLKAGTIPGFVTMLPYREGQCDEGTMWKVLGASGR